MYDAYSRMELLLGQTGVDRLGRAQIAVFGLGGVGSCHYQPELSCFSALFHTYLKIRSFKVI